MEQAIINITLKTTDGNYLSKTKGKVSVKQWALITAIIAQQETVVIMCPECKEETTHKLLCSCKKCYKYRPYST